MTKSSFPVSLPKRCINLLTYENDIVLDPFMGSGSTAVASIETNRNFLGCDNSKENVDISKERINNFFKEKENKENYKKFF